MAQWLGQFSGNTHDTRVEDVETALRLAVRSLKNAASELERRRKAKAVRNLAKRLLLARRRAVKARLVAAQRVATEEALAARAREIEALREREELVDAQGVAGILEEFDAGEAPPASASRLPEAPVDDRQGAREFGEGKRCLPAGER